MWQVYEFASDDDKCDFASLQFGVCYQTIGLQASKRTSCYTLYMVDGGKACIRTWYQPRPTKPDYAHPRWTHSVFVVLDAYFSTNWMPFSRNILRACSRAYCLVRVGWCWIWDSISVFPTGVCLRWVRNHCFVFPIASPPFPGEISTVRL